MAKDYYIFQNVRLFVQDRSLMVEYSDGEKKPFPVESVNTIYLFGEVDLNTRLLNFLASHKIILHVFNYYDFYSGSFVPRETLLAGKVLIHQAEHYSHAAKRLFLAKQFVLGAAHNILKNIKYHHKRKKELESTIYAVETLQSQIDHVSDVPALMGIEGNIRQIYYQAWNQIIDIPIDFEKRVYHPADNMINTLISYCNSLVYTTCLSEIYHTQLSPLISFLHEPGHRRYSLALDLAEIFKPIFADRLIFRVLNRKQIGPDDFHQELQSCRIKESALKIILREYDQTLETVVEHPQLKRKVSYRRIVRLDAYRLVKHILQDETYQPTRSWW